MARLNEIGERRLIDEVFATRYSREGYTFGDDCALIIDTPAGAIVASTDPAPQPVAWELGFKDYYHWGWLLGAVNLSDLAAAGAKPLGLLSSLTLPNDMPLDDLTRFLDGVDDCCEAFGCPVVGGNLKEGDAFRCDATVVGRVEGSHPLSRRGAQVGDRIVAIGRSGYFWSALIALTRGYDIKSLTQADLIDAIVRPVPQIGLGLTTLSLGKVHASTDASDGLYYALHCLTVSQGLGFRLDRSMIHFPEVVNEVAALADVDPLRLLLGFGDLQLVLAVAEEDLDTIGGAVQAVNERMLVLGVVTDTGRLELAESGSICELSNFDNERLTTESQFTAGLLAYEKRLLNRPLTISADSFETASVDKTRGAINVDRGSVNASND